MAKAARRRPSIDSFGPEVLAALLKGAKEKVTLRTTYRRAATFRRRLHELRAVMRESNHPLATIVARTKIEITWGEDANMPHIKTRYSSRNVPFPEDSDAPALLILRPHDSEFHDQLLAAGVRESELDHDPLEAAAGGSAPDRGEDETLDSILSRYSETHNADHK